MMGTRWVVGITHLPFNVAMRDARRTKGWTLKQLCILADVSAVGQYERLAAWPTPRAAERIAEALDLPVRILFPDEVGAQIRGRPLRRAETQHEVELLSLDSGALRQLSAGSAGDPDAALGAEERSEEVAALLDSLNERERRVLQLRFGLEDGRTHTFEEIGLEYHVHRERIRQIEARALRKLRHPVRLRRLRDDGWPESSGFVSMCGMDHCDLAGHPVWNGNCRTHREVSEPS